MILYIVFEALYVMLYSYMCYFQNYSQESVKIIAEMFGLLYNK